MVLPLLHLVLLLHRQELGTLLLGQISLLNLLSRRSGVYGWQLVVTVREAVARENIRHLVLLGRER